MFFLGDLYGETGTFMGDEAGLPKTESVAGVLLDEAMFLDDCGVPGIEPEVKSSFFATARAVAGLRPFGCSMLDPFGVLVGDGP